MIVVAIIGILAAVAIPGFMSYIKSSKTAEAKENLKAIGDGALSFYETEHPGSTGMTVTTKTYPAAASSVQIPATAQAVGVKADPQASAALIAADPWKSLNFRISKPFYYQYNYISAANGQVSDALFAAQANASLSTSNDSTFEIKGNNCGILSAIMDTSGSGTNGAVPTLSAPSAVANCNAAAQ